MAKISKALKKILLKAGPPKEFEEWCEDKALLVPMDIALLAKDEDAIENSLAPKRGWDPSQSPRSTV